MANISTSTLLWFLLTVMGTLWLFSKTSTRKKHFVFVGIWMLIIGALGYSGFFKNTATLPPRFPILLVIPLLFIIFSFCSKKGQLFIDTLQLKWLTLVHVVRIPVELILYSVFLQGLIPELMTFEGYNFDVLSGITAPLIFYGHFKRNWIGKKGLLIWNVVCFFLLINILVIAILSAQSPLQRLAFDQPNTMVVYFPFVWLPGLIVPIVMFSHLASIRLLLKQKSQ